MKAMGSHIRHRADDGRLASHMMTTTTRSGWMQWRLTKYGHLSSGKRRFGAAHGSWGAIPRHCDGSGRVVVTTMMMMMMVIVVGARMYFKLSMWCGCRWICGPMFGAGGLKATVVVVVAAAATSGRRREIKHVRRLGQMGTSRVQEERAGRRRVSQGI